MKRSRTILIITEGINPESELIKTMWKHFFVEEAGDKTEVKVFTFGTDIYQLYQKMMKWESASDFDVVQFVIDNNNNPKGNDEASQLQILKPKISEVYLFFDYDGQAQANNAKASDQDVTEMLEFFDDENGSGKIYISYPMIEAVRHYKSGNGCNYKQCRVDAKKNILYKNSAKRYSPSFHSDKLSKEFWYSLSAHFVKKGNCIVNSSYSLPDYKGYTASISQSSIFQCQLDKFIKASSTVVVLSCLPFFLVEYFGFSFFNNLQPLIPPSSFP